MLVFLQNAKTRELLALEVFQRRAAAGADPAELIVAVTKLANDSGGIATTDNAECVGAGNCLSYGASASAKASISATPIGPFQNTVLASAIASEKSLAVSGPMSRPSLSAGI